MLIPPQIWVYKRFLLAWSRLCSMFSLEAIGLHAWAQIETALCPCQNSTLFWGAFVTYQAPLDDNSTSQVWLTRP